MVPGPNALENVSGTAKTSASCTVTIWRRRAAGAALARLSSKADPAWSGSSSCSQSWPRSRPTRRKRTARRALDRARGGEQGDLEPVRGGRIVGEHAVQRAHQLSRVTLDSGDLLRQEPAVDGDLHVVAGARACSSAAEAPRTRPKNAQRNMTL